MANGASDKVEKRLTAAQRVRAKMAEREKALAASAEAAAKARRDRVTALAEADAAEDRFRAAIDDMVKVGKRLGYDLDDIAELADVPVAEVRAARRPRQVDGGPGLSDEALAELDAHAGPDRDLLVTAGLVREVQVSVALDRDQTHVVGEPAAAAS